MLMQETCHDTICLLMSSQAQAACLLQLVKGPIAWNSLTLQLFTLLLEALPPIFP